MSQAFSLYGELTVRQNLVLHAQLFTIAGPYRQRGAEMAENSSSRGHGRAARRLPLGMRQRLSLAVAMIHQPGDADPRRAHLGRRPGGARRVLAAVDRGCRGATGDDLHLDALHERGQRCDRISMMHAGRCSTATRRGLVQSAVRRPGSHLHRLPGRGGGGAAEAAVAGAPPPAGRAPKRLPAPRATLQPARLLSYPARGAGAEPRPDRLALALLGSIC